MDEEDFYPHGREFEGIILMGVIELPTCDKRYLTRKKESTDFVQEINILCFTSSPSPSPL